MGKFRRFSAAVAVILFVATLISAWRVSVSDAENIWYVPLLLAVCCAGMTVAALHGRHKKNPPKQM